MRFVGRLEKEEGQKKKKQETGGGLCLHSARLPEYMGPDFCLFVHFLCFTEY